MMIEAAPTHSRSQRTALLGLLVNILLALAKLIAGILGHCYALIADAIESIADIVGSVVIWGGLHIAARPADRDHPYGHGKAEAMAALVVVTLLFAAGVGIAAKAVDEILTPHHTPAPWTLIVLVAVIAVKWALARYASRIARLEGSGALEVDAVHHRTDILTSAAAFIGISIAVFGQRFFGLGDRWATADDWAALAASGVIMWNAVRLARLPMRELMDAEPAEVLTEARRITLAVPGVRGIEKARARTSGGRHHVELHVEVDPAMSVADAHTITGMIKSALKAARPAGGVVVDVLVHVEPWRQPPAAPAGTLEPTRTRTS